MAYKKYVKYHTENFFVCGISSIRTLNQHVLACQKTRAAPTNSRLSVVMRSPTFSDWAEMTVGFPNGP